MISADWRAGYAHCEGNAVANAKASMMDFSVAVPIEAGKLQLGVWQSVYFYEFDGSRERKVWVQLLGG